MSIVNPMSFYYCVYCKSPHTFKVSIATKDYKAQPRLLKKKHIFLRKNEHLVEGVKLLSW